MRINLLKNTWPMINRIKSNLLLNIKNLHGWRTRRKIVVFSVDDYGNVRLDSKTARENLDMAGMKVLSRFDAFDTLETREDLEMLYEVLNTVKDKNGNPAVFTPFAMPCNINFEKMAEEDYSRYYYELLPQTYNKLEVKNPVTYAGAWDLWQEGINKGLMKPQFHGREHFSLKVFEEKLEQRNHQLLTALKNRSYTSISDSGYSTISITAAYDFSQKKEMEVFPANISDGIEKFKKVYGLQPLNFTPPAYSIHPELFGTLAEKGIKFIDLALFQKEHQGSGKYKTRVNYTGKQINGLTVMVRNAVFEPTVEHESDWVNFTIKQIEAAFRWNRPAVISSHRVNFCGFIDPKNRQTGLDSLQQLLKKIVTRWPDVEFMGADQLGSLIKLNKS